MISLPNVPQSPGQVLSKGIEIGVNSYVRLILFTSLVGFIGLIPVLYLALHIGDTTVSADVLSEARDAGWYLIELACLLANALIQGILVMRLDNLVQRGNVDFHAEWQRGLHALLPLFIASVVFLCALIVGYVLLIVPGVILTISLLFFQFCVVLDRQGPIAGLNRSHTLVWGNWWRTFGVVILMVLLVLLIVVVLMVPVALLLDMHPAASVLTGRDLLVRGVMQMLGAVFLGPFVLAIMYVQYQDLKLRQANTVSA
ncbi:MAG TPA: hypothetical protein VFM15_04310 [Gammaproteobacteria bacterium]|nr:hypothetical protein [Gammaproteobacteria bacterium]